MNDSNEIRYGHDFELIWENHPFFGRRFRNIFENITTSCWRPTVFSGEMSLRSGKRIEHSKELYPNCNTDSTKTQRWIQLIDTLRQDKHIYEMGNRIGGKRRPKNYHKTKRINKRRNKKTRGHRKN